MPDYGEDLDDIVGILYVKDIFYLDEATFSAEKYMREPFFTYESKPLDELLAELKNSRLAVAIVLDEYGGTSGMITTEDIVEEIVGEIGDEYDDEEDEIEVIKDNEFVVDGSTRLEDFNEIVGTELESEEVDTIAGYILRIFRKTARLSRRMDCGLWLRKWTRIGLKRFVFINKKEMGYLC